MRKMTILIDQESGKNLMRAERTLRSTETDWFDLCGFIRLDKM